MNKVKAPRQVGAKPLAVGGFIMLAVIAFGYWQISWREPSPGVDPTRSTETVRLGAQRPVREMTDQTARSSTPQAALATEMQTSPWLHWLAAALESIQHEPDALLHEEKLASLIRELAMADLPAALDFIRQQTDSGFNRDLVLRLVQRWAENDPTKAANWVSQNSVGQARVDAIRSVAIAWANQSLPDAVNWVQQLTGNDRVDGILSVAYEAARSEPIEALRMAMELPTSPDRDELITHTTGQWAATDPESAAEWAKQITNERLRECVLAGIATAWGETDSVAAATLAMEWLKPGRQQDDAVVGIVQRWVQNEPQNAAAWVAAFPEGQLRNTALENLVKLWADLDSVQVGVWLKDVDLGPSLDAAIGAYVSQIAPSSPELAAEWAEKIESQAIRDREMVIVGEAWMNKDAITARVWIDKTPLSSEIKAQLLASGLPLTL